MVGATATEGKELWLSCAKAAGTYSNCRCALAAKVVETQGKGSVETAMTVVIPGKGSVPRTAHQWLLKDKALPEAAEAVGTNGKGTALATQQGARHRQCLPYATALENARHRLCLSHTPRQRERKATAVSYRPVGPPSFRPSLHHRTRVA